MHSWSEISHDNMDDSCAHISSNFRNRREQSEYEELEEYKFSKLNNAYFPLH